MLKQFEQTQQKWTGVNLLIDRWLLERQDLLVTYCELSGLSPYYQEKCKSPKTEDVKRFCQLLIDYISAGHFEIFVTNSEHQIQAVEQLVHKINKSTDFALAFNDTYALPQQQFDCEALFNDLAKLGQYLEERFSLEDQVVSLIFGR